MKPTARMLVVDDEPDMLDFLERVFRHAYRVERASSVDEALPILERVAIDVVITDHRMPRRSGFELLQIVARERPGAVRLLLSGYSDIDAPGGVADASLVKPVDADTLRFAVAEARRQRTETAGSPAE